MRKLISTTIVTAVLSVAASAAFAQTAAPAPNRPASCKAGEMYDATLKTCTVQKN